MKIKNSTMLLGAVMGLLSVQAVSADTVKVGIAAEPYPPFASADAAGTWQGWEIEMIGAICTAAEIDCEITPVSWDGIIPALTSKKIDMIMASMSITAERSKTIDFSNKYYNTPASIVGDKGIEMDATPDGLSGKILGVQAGTIHREYALKHFAPVVDQIKEYQTQDEANQDLAAGRIDATQADSLALATFVESEQGQSCCEFKGDVAGDVDILGPGVGVGLRKGEDELKEKLNNAIAAIRENGEYTTISEKYFNFDIYGE